MERNYATGAYEKSVNNRDEEQQVLSYVGGNRARYKLKKKETIFIPFTIPWRLAYTLAATP